MKILLAVDGSAYTKKMLAYLTTHLEVFHASNEFTIFTVQMPLPPRARAAVGATRTADRNAKGAPHRGPLRRPRAERFIPHREVRR